MFALHGCAQARDAASSAAYTLNPFASTELSVNAVSVQGPYLLAEVGGRKEQLRLLAPITPACTVVLQPEARVRYRKSGVFGRLTRDDESCDAVGVASLQAWRDRQPRRRSAQMVPRATARFSLLAETETHLLVRGRFPLAARVNIPAGFDLVALLPADDVCRRVVARGQGSLEFRPAGRDPFRLLSGSDACVVEGFAMPPSSEARRSPSARYAGNAEARRSPSARYAGRAEGRWARTSVGGMGRAGAESDASTLHRQ